MVDVQVFPDITDKSKFVEFLEVDYVSLVSNSTYGPPALIAKSTKNGGKQAGAEETVLYLNTAIIPMFTITPLADDEE